MKHLTTTMIFLWAVFLVVGSYNVTSYKVTPGDLGVSERLQPEHEAAFSQDGLPTLLVFAHPRCPCTTATLRQLERVLAKCEGKVSTTILFLQPVGQAASWCKTDLWKHANTIPGVTTQVDKYGHLARQFDVHTSGTTLLFDSDGHPVFRGGITPLRGYEGDSIGVESIQAYLLTGSATCDSAQTFGCAFSTDSTVSLPSK